MLRLTVSAAALLIAGPALASGYVAPPAPLPPVVPEIEQDWTGFYIGGQIDLIADSSVEVNGVELGEYEGELYGVFAGYRYDLGDFVVGGEVDYMVGSIDAVATQPGFAGTTDNDVTLIRAGVEGGYDLGDA